MPVVDLLLPIALAMSGCPETPVSRTVIAPLLPQETIIFKELLARSKKPAEDNLSDTMNSTAEGATDGANTPAGADLKKIPTPGGERHVTFVSHNAGLTGEHTVTEGILPALSSSVKRAEEQAESASRLNTAALLPGASMISVVPQNTQKELDFANGPSANDRMAEGDPRVFEGDRRSRGAMPENISENLSKDGDCDHIAAKMHPAEPGLAIPTRDARPPADSFPISADEMPGDQKSVTDNISLTDTPAKGTESTVDSREQRQAGRDAEPASSFFDAQEDAAYPELTGRGADTGQQHSKDSADGAHGSRSGAGMPRITAGEQNTAFLPVDSGTDAHKASYAASLGDGIPAVKHAGYQEIVGSRVVNNQFPNADKPKKDGSVFAARDVASKESLPNSSRSEAYTDAQITSPTMREWADAEYELSVAEQQFNKESEGKTPPHAARTPTGFMLSQGETAAVPKNDTGANPAHEPMRTAAVFGKEAWVMTRKGDASLKLSVDTDSAGEIKIDLMLNRGVIHGQIQASDEMGKNLIEKNLSGLLQSLIHEGLHVGNFSVSLRGKQSRANDDTSQNKPEMNGMASHEKIEGSVAGDRLVSIFV